MKQNFKFIVLFFSLFLVILTFFSCGDTEISQTYLNTPAITAYEQLLNGTITHEELLKYVEVQKQIVEDVNILLDEYRTGIYPIASYDEPHAAFRESPFPKDCAIPSNLKWEDLHLVLADPAVYQFGYHIVIPLENYFKMHIEAGCTSYDIDGENIGKVWLWNVTFYYGNFDDCDNLILFAPNTAISVHKEEFNEFMNKTISDFKPDKISVTFLNYNHSDEEISVTVQYNDNEQIAFTFGILRDNGKESYELLKTELKTTR